MARYRWLIVAVVVVLLAVVVWFFQRETRPPVAVDLVQQFPSAVKKSNIPVEQAFAVTTATIRGETKPCIFEHPTSRLTFRLTPPAYAWLTTSLALRPEAWDKPGDGVVFLIGISDGRRYDLLLTEHIDPFGNPGDRRWIPVSIDLSAYAGREVDLMFNTYASQPGRGVDTRNDWAIWGAPAIQIGR